MRGELRARRYAARRVLAALPMTAVLVATLGCDAKSPDFVRPSSLAFAALQVTLPEPALLLGSFLSCTNPNSPPGPVLRWSVPPITVQETSGIGVSVQSFTLTLVVPGKEAVEFFNAGPVTFGTSFGGCGGTNNRVEAGQRRCTNVNANPVFCAFPGDTRPQQLIVTVSGIDDNGFPVSGRRSISVASAP